MVEALASEGHDVTICGGMPATEQASSKRAYSVHPLNEYEAGLFSRVHPGIRGLFLGDVTRRWLESLEAQPDAVILYGTHLGYLLRLLSYCKKRKIPLILDVVEWYDPRHLPGGILGPFAVSNELAMRYWAKKANGMFVISSYLQRYYDAAGCQTLRIPPIFTDAPSACGSTDDLGDALNLCYIGSPGKKESMNAIFEGLRLLKEKGIAFTMHVVGLTVEEFSKDFDRKLVDAAGGNDSVKFYGRKENGDARNLLRSCDFLLLLRRDLRVTRAGFPSKVAESLRLGVPVIANLSSDMHEFLKDGENGFVAAAPTGVELAKAVAKAKSLSRTQLSEMKEKARKAAENSFSVAAHAARISNFLSEMA